MSPAVQEVRGLHGGANRGTDSGASKSESEGVDEGQGAVATRPRTSGATLAPAASPLRPFVSSASNEWGTPEAVLVRVRAMFAPGGIDLDPCSSPEANTRVGAWSFYDKATDGLSEAVAWVGNVYINPHVVVSWGIYG
ncbi:hypothetical protein Vretifemale_9419 [Volvox reticuliferus]|uniref:Uncharacterized protein n=1 Tax=Volvox reticuliferus TaxID=1737510 RepID=A0A8J4CEN9_9CHLO|nr:hypothetical protein Vretifemale_9419 [Volvox reticuliferus]